MNVIDPLVWFVPAYVANSSATLSRWLPAVHPIDFGRRWRGKRVLGDGKTWEGLLIGITFGTLAGILVYDLFGLGTWREALALSFGAILGDIVGSFVKRRAGLRRGEEASLLDQLDFVFGAFLLLPPPPEYAVVILAITPILHRIANVIGYVIGVKREPW